MQKSVDSFTHSSRVSSRACLSSRLVSTHLKRVKRAHALDVRRASRLARILRLSSSSVHRHTLTSRGGEKSRHAHRARLCRIRVVHRADAMRRARAVSRVRETSRRVGDDGRRRTTTTRPSRRQRHVVVVICAFSARRVGARGRGRRETIGIRDCRRSERARRESERGACEGGWRARRGSRGAGGLTRLTDDESGGVGTSTRRSDD